MKLFVKESSVAWFLTLEHLAWVKCLNGGSPSPDVQRRGKGVAYLMYLILQPRNLMHRGCYNITPGHCWFSIPTLACKSGGGEFFITGEGRTFTL